MGLTLSRTLGPRDNRSYAFHKDRQSQLPSRLDQSHHLVSQTLGDQEEKISLVGLSILVRPHPMTPSVLRTSDFDFDVHAFALARSSYCPNSSGRTLSWRGHSVRWRDHLVNNSANPEGNSPHGAHSHLVDHRTRQAQIMIQQEVHHLESDLFQLR